MLDSILFQCSELEKTVNTFRLEGITFQLMKGSILGVIGRNGAGKTTLSRLLLGCNKPDSGDCILNHHSLKEDCISYQKQIAYVLNETPFPTMIHSLDCGRIYGCYYDSFSLEQYRMLLKEFRVPEKKTIYRLSHGQQIRQQLAFALSYESNLLILDEPAANLDVEFREEFYEYVRNYPKDETRSIIYISHLVDELEQLADHILWIREPDENRSNNMKRGTQYYYGSIEELRDQYQMFEGEKMELREALLKTIVGGRKNELSAEYLLHCQRADFSTKERELSRNATLKEIMYYSEKGEI